MKASSPATSNGHQVPSKSEFSVSLKIHRWRQRAGSSPATGTTLKPLKNQGFQGFFLPLAEVEIRCVGCCRKPLFELFPRKTGGRKPLLCLAFSALPRSRRSFRASADAAGSNGGRKKAASAQEIVHDCLRGSNLRAVYRKSSAAKPTPTAPRKIGSQTQAAPEAMPIMRSVAEPVRSST